MVSLNFYNKIHISHWGLEEINDLDGIDDCWLEWQKCGIADILINSGLYLHLASGNFAEETVTTVFESIYRFSERLLKKWTGYLCNFVNVDNRHGWKIIPQGLYVFVILATCIFRSFRMTSSLRQFIYLLAEHVQVIQVTYIPW